MDINLHNRKYKMCPTIVTIIIFTLLTGTIVFSVRELLFLLVRG